MEEVLGAVARVNAPPALDFAAVHAVHGDFVWLTLQRFGVRTADLDDAFQEVFIVVDRKLPTFDGSCAIESWLFGICRRVAAATRRRAHRRRELYAEAAGLDVADQAADPEEAAAVREAEAVLDRALDEMDLDRRATFVMFEIDGLPCEQIAVVTGVAIGTVYARLHTARKEFAQILQRLRARKGGPR